MKSGRPELWYETRPLERVYDTTASAPNRSVTSSACVAVSGAPGRNLPTAGRRIPWLISAPSPIASQTSAACRTRPGWNTSSVVVARIAKYAWPMVRRSRKTSSSSGADVPGKMPNRHDS